MKAVAPRKIQSKIRTLGRKAVFKLKFLRVSGLNAVLIKILLKNVLGFEIIWFVKTFD